MFITFGDEVEKIWKQPFSNVTILWFLVSRTADLLSICGFDSLSMTESVYLTSGLHRDHSQWVPLTIYLINTILISYSSRLPWSELGSRSMRTLCAFSRNSQNIHRERCRGYVLTGFLVFRACVKLRSLSYLYSASLCCLWTKSKDISYLYRASYSWASSEDSKC
jgi:hypothetical protein